VRWFDVVVGGIIGDIACWVWVAETVYAMAHWGDWVDGCRYRRGVPVGRGILGWLGMQGWRLVREQGAAWD